MPSVDATSQHRFLEVHPECSFTAMTGARPGAEAHAARPPRAAKKRWQRTSGPIEHRPSAAVRPDDVLDAYAVLWTALRHRRGESRTFGGDETDGRGLVMRIVV